jgi:hypothetical protein
MKIAATIIVLSLNMSLYGQGVLTPNEIKSGLQSSDLTEQLHVLKDLNSGVQSRASAYTQQRDKALFLASTRRYLDPFQSELTQSANADESSVRAISALLLGYTSPTDETKTVLTKLVRDAVPDVQYNALGSIYLADVDTTESRSALLDLMSQSENDNLFRASAKVAAAWQIPEAINVLNEALRNDNPYFKTYAADFLSAYGTKAASSLPELIQQLNAAKDPNLKRSLQAAIESIKGSQMELRPETKSQSASGAPIAYEPLPSSSEKRETPSAVTSNSPLPTEASKPSSVVQFEQPKSTPWPWIIGAILLLAVAGGILLKLLRK